MFRLDFICLHPFSYLGNTAVNTAPASFSLTGGVTAAGSVVGSVACITDWISIPCATNTKFPFAQSGTPSVCVDRICGMVFNSVNTPAASSSVSVYSMI